MEASMSTETTEGMSAEKVILRGSDDDNTEALKMWAWFAVKQAGGKVIVTYNDFFTCQGDATLYWKIDPVTLTLTIVAE
jgi:hypothetical protein